MNVDDSGVNEEDKCVFPSGPFSFSWLISRAVQVWRGCSQYRGVRPTRCP